MCVLVPLAALFRNMKCEKGDDKVTGRFTIVGGFAAFFLLCEQAMRD